MDQKEKKKKEYILQTFDELEDSESLFSFLKSVIWFFFGP